MNSWIHFGHIPIFVLLTIAEVACIVVAATFFPVPRELRVTPRGRRKNLYAAGSVLVLMVFSVLVVLLPAVVGVVFGFFYAILMAVMFFFPILPVLAIPAVSAKFESFSSMQTLVVCSIVVVCCFALSFLYLVLAPVFGMPLKFGME